MAPDLSAPTDAALPKLSEAFAEAHARVVATRVAYYGALRAYDGRDTAGLLAEYREAQRALATLERKMTPAALIPMEPRPMLTPDTDEMITAAARFTQWCVGLLLILAGSATIALASILIHALGGGQ